MYVDSYISHLQNLFVFFCFISDVLCSHSTEFKVSCHISRGLENDMWCSKAARITAIVAVIQQN